MASGDVLRRRLRVTGVVLNLAGFVVFLAANLLDADVAWVFLGAAVCGAGLVLSAFFVVVVLAQDGPGFWFGLPLFLVFGFVLNRQGDWFERFESERGKASWLGLVRYLRWLADQTTWPRARVLAAFAVSWFVPPAFMLALLAVSAVGPLGGL